MPNFQNIYALNHHPPFFCQAVKHYGDIFLLLSKKIFLELKKFILWTQENRLRCMFLINEKLGIKEHLLLLEAYFSAHKVLEGTKKVLYGLVKLKRLDLLPLVLCYVDSKNARKVPLYLNHATSLSAAEVKTFKEKLEEKIKKPIEIYFHNNKRLIYGYVIFIEYKMLDASLSRFILNLKQKVDHVFS